MTAARRAGGYGDLLRSWGGELVASSYDADADAFMFICVHSTLRGPAGGGIRMKAYDSAEDALADGMRLSSAMTLKMAICDAPLGGGKSVIAVAPSLDGAARRRVLDRYAALLGSLHGTYYGAPDMNTGPADMDYIYERSPYVFCRTPERGGSGSTTHASGTARSRFTTTARTSAGRRAPSATRSTRSGARRPCARA